MELVKRYLYGKKGCQHQSVKYLRTEEYNDSACVNIFECLTCGKVYKDE